MQGYRKVSDAQLLVWLGVNSQRAGFSILGKKAGCVIKQFSDQALANQLVLFCVRKLLESAIDFERTQINPLGWPERFFVFFQHEKIAKPGSLRGLESTLLICGPEVAGVAESLFNAVIEVIAKASHLRFDFDYRNQIRTRGYYQVPFFGGAKETRKSARCFFGGVDSWAGQSGVLHDGGNEADKAVGMLSTSHSGSVSSVLAARAGSLALFLAKTRFPEMFYRFAKLGFDVNQLASPLFLFVESQSPVSEKLW
ncbi:MAG: hypothetical protein M1369_02250 [Deinococcus sp.]|nr:hypothetical protein [Deinococcus sp.]MCL5964595.1 hypothetical protein [Deinococcus sp.]